VRGKWEVQLRSRGKVHVVVNAFVELEVCATNSFSIY